jgi:NAD+ synthase (glutamine-hydrolysing)
VKLGIAQIATRAGDFDRTGERIVSQSEQAAAQGVDLLVFPAATLTGPFPVPLADQQGFMADLSSLMADISKRIACPCIVPAVTLLEGEPRLEVFLLPKDGVIPLRFTSMMNYMLGVKDPDSDDEDEDPYDPRSAFITFEFGGLQFVLATDAEELYDLLDYEYELDVALYLPLESFTVEDSSTALAASLQESNLLQDVRTMGAWLVTAGSLGCYDTCIYTGGSFVASPTGKLVCSAPSFEEALIVAELDAPSDHSAEHEEPAFAQSDFSSPFDLEIYHFPFFCWEALTMGLRDFVQSANKEDVVLALDGTLTSNALAVLACDALGPLHVHALLATPLAGTHYVRSIDGAGRGGARASHPWQQALAAAQHERACRRLATNLRIELVERDPKLLAVSAAKIEDAYSEEERLAALDLEESLVQAELRSLGFAHDALLLGAYDKTWRAIEARSNVIHFDLLPFGDLYRTDVLELARTRNAVSPVIPDVSLHVCDVPAVEVEEHEYTTSPARPGSKSTVASDDEVLMRAIDASLTHYMEWSRSISRIAQIPDFAQIAPAVVGQLRRRDAARTAVNVPLAISGVSLMEQRLPLGMAWRDHVRELPKEPSDEELAEAVRKYARSVMPELDGATPQDLWSDLRAEFGGEFGAELGAAELRGAESHNASSSSAKSVAHASHGGTPDLADILSYLRDLTDDLGGPMDISEGFGAHLAADDEGRMRFGGISGPGSTPFSEN